MYRLILLLILLLLVVSFGLVQPAFAHPGASTTIEHYTHEIEHEPKRQRLHILRGIADSNDARYDEALADGFAETNPHRFRSENVRRPDFPLQSKC